MVASPRNQRYLRCLRRSCRGRRPWPAYSLVLRLRSSWRRRRTVRRDYGLAKGKSPRSCSGRRAALRRLVWTVITGSASRSCRRKWDVALGASYPIKRCVRKGRCRLGCDAGCVLSCLRGHKPALFRAGEPATGRFLEGVARGLGRRVQAVDNYF